MTLTSQQTRVIYRPDGNTTTFGVPFPVFDAADVECISVADSGAEHTYTSGFTVHGIAQGVVTVVFSSPPPATVRLVIRRSTRQVQESDYPIAGRFPAKTLERDLDRIVAMLQDLSEHVDRSLKVDSSQESAPSAGDFLRIFDEKIRDAQGAAEAAAAAAEQAEKTMSIIPVPVADDTGKVLYVALVNGEPRYVLMKVVGVGNGAGMAEYAIPVTEESGLMTIRLADLGHPEQLGLFNPIVNLLSMSPYTFHITQRTPEEFTVQLYRDGKPGAEIVEFVELGDFELGDGTEIGQEGEGADVTLLVSLPL
jgi:hypothetical protein